MMLFAFLLCSLALAAEAGGPTASPAVVKTTPASAPGGKPQIVADKKEKVTVTTEATPPPVQTFKDCNENIYDCYVPESCFVSSDNPDYPDKNSIRKITDKEKITANCSALIKLYSHNDNYLRVEINSFDTAVKSINFSSNYIKRGTSNPDHKFSFSCVTGSQMTGTFENHQEEPKVIQVHNSVDITLPIACGFDVKMKTKILDAKADEPLLFIIDTKKYPEKFKKEYYKTIVNERCDMTLFTDDNERQTNEFFYNKIQGIGIGKVPYCDKGYKKEYQKSSASPYIEIENQEDEPSCQDNKIFYINKEPVPWGVPIYIRCKAPANLFCNTTVKHVDTSDTSKTRINMTEPDIDQDIPSKLECPPTHPILEVDGKVATGNETIECRNYEGENKAFWFFRGKVLRDTGPEVNCLNRYECHKKKKIPQSSVRFGDLVDYLPVCKESGTLRIQGEKKSEAKVHVFCDNVTGDFMYNIGEENKHAVNATFFCEFPPIADPDADRENMIRIKTAVGTTVGISFAAAAAIIAIVFALSFLRVFLLKRQMVKQHKQEWHAFAINKKEKKRLKKLKAAANPDGKDTKSEMSILQPIEDIGKINPLILACRQRARNTMKIDSKTQKCVIGPRYADVSAADYKAAYDAAPVNKKIYALDLGDLKTGTRERMDAAFREDFHGPDSEDAKEPEDKKKV